MAYKFTGRIKKLGCEKNNNFCEFYVDNSIIINNEEKGVAYNEKNEFKIVETFEKIDDKIFGIISGALQERFEIEFDAQVNPENQNNSDDNGGKASGNANNPGADDGNNVEDRIIKVTILR